MKNEIRKLNDLRGKSISDFKLDCGELWLKFTDNTFVVLVVNDITEGFGYTKNEVNIYQYGKGKTEKALVDLGIITEKEYKDACEQEEIEYQKQEEEREKEYTEKLEKLELEQLEKLRLKYGL